MDLIVVSHLSKEFPVFHKEPGIIGSLRSLFYRRKEIKKAVSDVSFEIKKGSITGLLGPNGSGKTTLMKMLTGILTPTGGTAEVKNHIPWQRKKDFLKQITLVMGQRSQLWWDLPAYDTFQFFEAIFDIDHSTFLKRVEALSTMLDVQDLLKIPVRKLSLGQRMRCELIASLIHEPKIVFLDEPTIGLDVVSQKIIRDFLKSYNDKHAATILLTSHNMNDIEQLCDHVVVVSHGKVVFDGQVKELSRTYGNERIIILHLSNAQKLPSLPPECKVIKEKGLVVEIAVPYNAVAKVTNELLSSLAIESLTIQEPDLDEIMRQFFLTT